MRRPRADSEAAGAGAAWTAVASAWVRAACGAAAAAGTSADSWPRATVRGTPSPSSTAERLAVTGPWPGPVLTRQVKVSGAPGRSRAVCSPFGTMS